MEFSHILNKDYLRDEVQKAMLVFSYRNVPFYNALMKKNILKHFEIFIPAKVEVLI